MGRKLAAGRGQAEVSLLMPQPAGLFCLPYRALHLASKGLSPKVKMTMKRKGFELLRDIKAAMRGQLKTLMKEDFWNYFTSDMNDEITCLCSKQEGLF